MSNKMYINVSDKTLTKWDSYFDDGNKDTGAMTRTGLSYQEYDYKEDKSYPQEVVAINFDSAEFSHFKNKFLAEFTGNKAFNNAFFNADGINLVNALKNPANHHYVIPVTPSLENVFSSSFSGDYVSVTQYNEQQYSKYKLNFSSPLTQEQRQALTSFVQNLDNNITKPSTDNTETIAQQYGADILNLYLFAQENKIIEEVPVTSSEPENTVVVTGEPNSAPFYQPVLDTINILGEAFERSLVIFYPEPVEPEPVMPPPEPTIEHTPLPEPPDPTEEPQPLMPPPPAPAQQEPEQPLMPAPANLGAVEEVAVNEDSGDIYGWDTGYEFDHMQAQKIPVFSELWWNPGMDEIPSRCFKPYAEAHDINEALDEKYAQGLYAGGSSHFSSPAHVSKEVLEYYRDGYDFSLNPLHCFSKVDDNKHTPKLITFASNAIEHYQQNSYFYEFPVTHTTEDGETFKFIVNAFLEIDEKNGRGVLDFEISMPQNQDKKTIITIEYDQENGINVKPYCYGNAANPLFMFATEIGAGLNSKNEIYKTYEFYPQKLKEYAITNTFFDLLASDNNLDTGAETVLGQLLNTNAWPEVVE